MSTGRFDLDCILARIDAAFSHEQRAAERNALYELYRWVLDEYAAVAVGDSEETP